MENIAILTTDAEVAELAGQLEAETAIAVDLEADAIRLCRARPSTRSALRVVPKHLGYIYT